MAESSNELAAFAQRLEKAVRAAGGRSVVAPAADVPIGTLDRYLKGRTEPTALVLSRIAHAIGVSVEWLTSGEGPFVAPAIASDAAPRVVDDELGADSVKVSLMDVRASAGPGSLTTDRGLLTSADLAVPEGWLRSLGVAPRNAQFLIADGDSMEPTIRHGDLLLADRGIDGLCREGIYVFVLAGLVMIKRLQSLADGSLLVLSDNPRYERQRVVPAEVVDVRVEARVKWYGRMF